MNLRHLVYFCAPAASNIHKAGQKKRVHFQNKSNLIFKIKHHCYHFLEESQRRNCVDHIEVPAMARRGGFFGRRQGPLLASGVRGQIGNQSERHDKGFISLDYSERTLSDDNMLCITSFFPQLEKFKNTRQPNYFAGFLVFI